MLYYSERRHMEAAQLVDARKGMQITTTASITSPGTVSSLTFPLLHVISFI